MLRLVATPGHFAVEHLTLNVSLREYFKNFDQMENMDQIDEIDEMDQSDHIDEINIMNEVG